MTENIAKKWLADLVSTAQQHDHRAYMNLISKNVSAVAVPAFENLGYENWSKQTEHEFKQGVIADVSYRRLKLRAVTNTRILFVNHETIITDDGSINAQGIECLLEKKGDTQWRLVQQHVLSNEKTRQYLPELTD